VLVGHPLEDPRRAALGALGVHPRRVVPDREHGAESLAGGPEHGARAADRGDLAAIRAADAPPRVHHRIAAEDGARERELGRRIGPAVLGEQVVRLGVVLRRDVEPGHAVQARRRVVDERDPPGRVRHDHPLGELREGGGDQGGRGADTGRKGGRRSVSEG
jgi:hypothetical protein